jgi:hypothetical protein
MADPAPLIAVRNHALQAGMSKKLTITVDAEVYDGLHSVICRRISRFLNDLARPHVAGQDLSPGYAAMWPTKPARSKRRLGAKPRSAMSPTNPLPWRMSSRRIAARPGWSPSIPRSGASSKRPGPR